MLNNVFTFRPARMAALFLTSVSTAWAAVSATLTPASLVSTSTTGTVVQVTGLTTGAAVTIERIVDANANGVADTGEFLAEIHTVTDGQWPSLAGVRNLNMSGDSDNTANGQISVTLVPVRGDESGRAAGAQLIRISSPTSAFTSFTRTLALTQAAQSQNIHGTVLNGAAAVANANVIVLVPDSDGDNRYALGTFTDATGAYTLNLPAGSYKLAVFKPGVVGVFGQGGTATLTAGVSLTKNLTVVSPTTTISGKISDVSGTPGLGGLQMFITTQTGQAVLATTKADGTYTAQVTADTWGIQPSEKRFGQLGYLRPADNGPDGFELAVSTLVGAVTNANITAAKATALIYGKVKDSANNPLAGIPVRGNHSDGVNNSDAVSDASGNYTLGVTAGTWNTHVNGDDPATAGYLLPGNADVVVAAGQAVTQDFILTLPNAHLKGTVTKDGVPQAGVVMGAYNQDTGTFLTGTSAVDGTFDVGVVGGTWTLQMENDSATALGLVGPSLEYTLAANQTVSAISFPVKAAVAHIIGKVMDESALAISNAEVYAYATVGGVDYVAGSHSDGSGNYTLPVLNGSWQVGVNTGDYTSSAEVTVVVAGSDVTRNFTLTKKPVFNEHPSDQNVTPGQTFVFSVNTSSSTGTATYLWQVSTNGGTSWSNLADNATYAGTDDNVLDVTASLGLNGYRYRCVATNTFGSATSNAALLTVTGSSLTFNTQPGNQTVSAGQGFMFTVQAGSTTGTVDYLWQVSTDGGAIWSNLENNATYSNVTSSTLGVIANTGLNGYRYRSVATDSFGSLPSNSALLTVTTAPTLASSLPANNASAVALTSTVSFTFSEPMQTGRSISWSPNVTASNFAYAWSGDGRTLTCTYNTTLPAGVTISWTLNPSGFAFNFKNTAGTSLASNTSGSFTTADPNNPSYVWSYKPFMPTALTQACAETINGLLYVAGGYRGDGSGVTNTLEVYDPARGTWATLSPMPTARCRAASGVVNGKLYVAGGYANGPYSTALEVYDPATDTWTTKHAMNIGHYEGVGGVIDGKFYVAGTSGDFTKSLEVYDPATDTWTDKTPMPNPRSAGGAVLNGLFYTIGGDSFGTVEAYDPATDSWTTKASLPGAGNTVYHPGVAVLNGKLYVVGGYNHGTAVDVYNAATNQWTSGPALSSSRGDCAVASLANTLFVVGGVDAPGQTTFPFMEQLGLAAGDPVTTLILKSDATTLAAGLGAGVPSASTLTKLNAGDTTGLTFQNALVGPYGTTTVELPSGSPAGTQVVSIPTGNGQNGFFKITFQLPVGYAAAQISCGATMDYYGRAFVNGNALTPAISSSQPTPVDGTIRSELGEDVFFSTKNPAHFHSGTNEFLVADINANGGASAGAFFALVTYSMTPPSGFEVWRQANFTALQLADSNVSGPLATPAGDGVTNLYKYAFDVMPFKPGYGSPLAVSQGAGNLVLVFPATRSDLTYTVKASADLVNWATTGVTVQTNGTQRTATYNTGSTRAFLKVFVTQP